MALPLRTGILVVRAWTEGDNGLRARLIWSPDIGSSPETISTTASADELQAIIRRWLELLLDGTVAASSGASPASGDAAVIDE